MNTVEWLKVDVFLRRLFIDALSDGKDWKLI